MLKELAAEIQKRLGFDRLLNLAVNTEEVVCYINRQVTARLDRIEDQLDKMQLQIANPPAYVILNGTRTVKVQNMDKRSAIMARMKDTPKRHLLLQECWEEETLPFSWSQRIAVSPLQQQETVKFDGNHPMSVDSVELHGGPWEIVGLRIGNDSVEPGYPSAVQSTHRLNLAHVEPYRRTVPVGCNVTVQVKRVQDVSF